MIKESTILELELTRQAETRANKTAKELHAKRVGLEAEIINALEAKQRVEGTRYRLAIETFIKTFIPSYKTCAIELSSEQAVTEWVIDHDPEEEGKKLVVEVRAPKSRAA
jgi:hypothetical protein